jgi:hypothetical protein
MSESNTDGFLQWLNARIEGSKESYQRDTNDRHTSISLGKVRAYKDVRKEYLERCDGTDTEQAHEANRDAVPENSKGRMSDEMYEATFDPMFDVADRWGIPMEDAEAFLESVGYFEHAATYNPEDEEHNA